MAARDREQKPASERRDQILAAAGEVFAARGIHAARIDDIAAAAGISKGTVYWHFASKDEIVVALVDSFYSQAHSGLVALREEAGTVVQRLSGYLRSYAAGLDEHRHLAPLATEFYALAPRQPSVRGFLEQYYARWTDALAALLDDGNQRGEITVGDTHSAARTLIELLDGAFLIWTVTPDAADLNDRMQAALDLLANGLRGTPDDPVP